MKALILALFLATDPAPIDTSAYAEAHSATVTARETLRRARHAQPFSSSDYASAKAALAAAEAAEATLEAQYRLDLAAREEALRTP